MVSDVEIKETVKNLETRGIRVVLVDSKKQALDEVLRVIPKGSEVMNGSSTTLNEIGFTDFLKKQKDFKNLHKKVLKEKDYAKASELRRKYTTAEYFLGSVNAIAQTGELVACDASGSRVGAYLFSAQHLVLVAGINKIVPDLESAIKRVKEYVFPLEDARAQQAYGMHSTLAKWVIIEKEFVPNRITLVLVKEKLGF